MIMENDKLHQRLFIVKMKLDLVTDKLKKYSDLHYTFLETEAVSKIRRYGKEYYKECYLKNENKIVSDFMKTFLYLKETEANLLHLKKYFTNDIRIIQSKMNQDE